MKFKPLEAMTFAQRFMLTVVIVLVILFALALFGYLTGRWDEAGAQPIPQALPPSEHDARLVALDKEAIEAAYRAHVQLMYSGWMKDDAGQPYRALTGTRQAQRAYIRSMDAIKRREEELKSRN